MDIILLGVNIHHVHHDLYVGGRIFSIFPIRDGGQSIRSTFPTANFLGMDP